MPCMLKQLKGIYRIRKNHRSWKHVLTQLWEKKKSSASGEKLYSLSHLTLSSHIAQNCPTLSERSYDEKIRRMTQPEGMPFTLTSLRTDKTVYRQLLLNYCFSKGVLSLVRKKCHIWANKTQTPNGLWICKSLLKHWVSTSTFLAQEVLSMSQTLSAILFLLMLLGFWLATSVGEVVGCLKTASSIGLQRNSCLTI